LVSFWKPRLFVVARSNSITRWQRSPRPRRRRQDSGYPLGAAGTHWVLEAIAGDCFGRGKDPRKDAGLYLQHDKRESREIKS
jgi:hypothetical protein